MTAHLPRVAPVLPVRSVNRALEHYRRLGFDADPYGETSGDEPIYGFLKRDGVEVHLALTRNLEPTKNTSAFYFYVVDAGALFEEWRKAGIEGRLDPPVDQPYGLREFIHLDPDGNLMRVGSEIRSGE